MRFDEEVDVLHAVAEHDPYMRIFVSSPDITPILIDEFDALLAEILPVDVKKLTIEELVDRVSVPQHATDLLSLEIERREYFPQHWHCKFIPFNVPGDLVVHTALTYPPDLNDVGEASAEP